MPRPNLALVWAFLSTVTAASSTVIYLFLAHNQPWAPAFVQLYASLGIVSGWLNALIYFLAPRTHILQTRKASVLFFSFSLFAAHFIYVHIFHQELTGERFAFLSISLIPVLYANAFGIEFYEGNYPWAYKRVVAFNIVLFLAGLGALIFARTESGLYRWGAVAGCPFFFLWLLDRWNRIDVPREKLTSFQPWLNPSLPVLERTLWDQWILARLDVLGWSFGIYVLGRLVTFTGNITYSYFLGTNSKANISRTANRRWWPWAVMLLAAPVAAGAIKYTWCAFLLGQILAWFLTVLLTSEFNSESSSYKKYLFIWIADLCLRSIGIYIAQDIKEYVPFLVFSSVAGLIISLLLWHKQSSKALPRRTSTKFPPADFPNTR